jgi:hypothetical protein
MRALLTIPHFYAQNQADHGSGKTDPSARLRTIETCITTLHETFGPYQGLYYNVTRGLRQTNRADVVEIDVVLCTTGENHLLAQLKLPPELYRVHRTSALPKLLGYECHAVLKENLGKYDYYGYLEDDLLISDPLLFIKLDWFCSQAGKDAVLQPNRFESSARSPIQKLYADCNLVDPAISPRYQNRKDRPRLEYETMGRKFIFQRVDNPHSGCFFLNAEQMAHWAAQPYFLDRATGFWGPLESAATLGIMRAFRLYKPARENAAFLEIRHLDNRYLANRLKLTRAMIEP